MAHAVRRVVSTDRTAVHLESRLDHHAIGDRRVAFLSDFNLEARVLRQLGGDCPESSFDERSKLVVHRVLRPLTSILTNDLLERLVLPECLVR